jgi:hypothetical protein
MFTHFLTNRFISILSAGWLRRRNQLKKISKQIGWRGTEEGLYKMLYVSYASYWLLTLLTAEMWIRYLINMIFHEKDEEFITRKKIIEWVAGSIPIIWTFTFKGSGFSSWPWALFFYFKNIFEAKSEREAIRANFDLMEWITAILWIAWSKQILKIAEDQMLPKKKIKRDPITWRIISWGEKIDPITWKVIGWGVRSRENDPLFN